MQRLLVHIALLLFPLLLFSQGDSLFFSDAIKIKYKTYKAQSERAFRNGDIEKGKLLFDSLVSHRLKGTTFDDFTFKKAGGAKLELSSIHKPIVLVTFASWCVPATGEIPALNRLAQKYRKDVQFVVLFWDRKHNMKKIAHKFNHSIIVCYAHESYKNDAPVVAAVKHTLGFPTAFYLDENRKVIDIKRCGLNQVFKKTQYQKAYALNYNAYLTNMAPLVMNMELKKEVLAVK
ncbi:TlpA family protein disulfide reductase [Flavobacterium sp. RHBU_24]|uniref:TlpA family protein disulfide reductase n=1 Tax=Flavobacterium sp. RHBU_24 TaxID=3391185 RepID=UPI003984C135